jgi:LPXTG-motif cell wall-anchored protein
MKGGIVMSRMFISKTIALLAALVVVFISVVVPTNVYAYEDMDTAKNGSASLTLQLPAASDSVKLYFVADMDTQTHITMKDEYKGLGVNIGDAESQDEWATKASIMSSQLINSGIEPTVAATDENNQAKFENLAFGIYLVVVDNCANATTRYTVSPNFISVPNSTDGETWIYDVNATLKYEAKPTITPPPEKLKFAVEKLWTNDGVGELRPKELKVKILNRVSEDAEWTEVEEVTLNSDNGWTYGWDADANGSEWKVQEEEIAGYALDKIDTVEEGLTTKFVITNRYIPTPTETPTPTPTSTPTPTPRTLTSTPRPTSTPRTYRPTATPRPNVTTRITHTTPKTGDDQNILLPMIGVLAAGLVLILLGFNLRKKPENENDETSS